MNGNNLKFPLAAQSSDQVQFSSASRDQVKMAALVKFTRAAGKLTNKSSLGCVVSVRNHWNKDFKPAPFPQTQKEREAAAKKYGIPVEEYQPYPDDGLGFGDYPKLKDQSIELRDPYYAWDYPEHKRNFGEPLHAEHDLYCEERWNNGKSLICSSSHTSYDNFSRKLSSQTTLLKLVHAELLPRLHGFLFRHLLLA